MLISKTKRLRYVRYASYDYDRNVFNGSDW